MLFSYITVSTINYNPTNYAEDDLMQLVNASCLFT